MIESRDPSMPREPVEPELPVSPQYEMWVTWARDRMQRLPLELHEETIAHLKLKRANEELDKKIKAAEVWMQHRKESSVHVLDIGTKVVLLTPKLVGTIKSASIMPNKEVVYRVDYWAGVQLLTALVGPDEIKEEDIL